MAELGRFDEAAAEYDFVERAYPGHAGVRAEAKAARDAAETARVQSKAAAATEREKAKAMAARILTAAGFEPLDCGTADDAKGIEPCSAPFNRPERVRHPRHVEHNGLQHP